MAHFSGAPVELSKAVAIRCRIEYPVGGVNWNFWSSSTLTRPGERRVKVPARSLPSLISEMPIAPNVLIMDIEGGEAQIPPDHFTLFNKIIIETHRKLIGDEPIDRIFQHLKGCGYANRGNIGGSFAFVADG